MAKRFIDTGILHNPWMREAPPKMKALWLACITECSNAGILAMDWPMLSLLCGETITEQEGREFLAGRFIDLGRGRFFFPDFIRFQYPKGIRGDNNNLKSIREQLLKFGICSVNLTLFEVLPNPKSTLDQPLTNPRPTLDQGLQEEEMDKEMEEEKDRGVQGGIHIEPFREKPFDAEKHHEQFYSCYGKEGKRGSSLRAYMQAIQRLGREPTNYPPIAAVKLLLDRAASARLWHIREGTESRYRQNPETWLEENMYLTDWANTPNTPKPDKINGTSRNHKDAAREYTDAARRHAEDSGL